MKKHKLNEHEKSVKELDSKIIQAKVALADKWLELRQVETVLATLQQQYVEAVLDLAKARGIDLDDKSQAWNFAGDTMTFTRRNNARTVED